MPHNKRFIDLSGNRYGRLVVLSFLGSRKWICLCDCGNKKILLSTSLRRGTTKSCGCYRREVTGNKRKTHGMSQSTEYKIWKDMRKRCLNHKNKEYHNYGGRGIKVCSRWSDFNNFYLDMGARPPGHTLDRIDVNGDYSPENCRWATHEQQSENKRNNHIIIYNGKPTILRDVAEICGIHFTTIIKRLNAGWSVEDATSVKPKLKQLKKELTK